MSESMLKTKLILINDPYIVNLRMCIYIDYVRIIDQYTFFHLCLFLLPTLVPFPHPHII